MVKNITIGVLAVVLVAVGFAYFTKPANTPLSGAEQYFTPTFHSGCLALQINGSGGLLYVSAPTGSTSTITVSTTRPTFCPN